MTDAMHLEQSLSYRLHRVARLGDRETGTGGRDVDGLTASEARCLAAIGSFAPLSINDLAHRAGQDKSQASRSTKALVARGLVDKETRPGDGRGVVLTPTRRGRTLHAKVLRQFATRDAALFAALSARERKAFGAMLDRIAASLEAP